MMEALFNLRLVKYDPFQGVFTAVAAKGSTVDRAGERFDFAGSKPYFKEWSDEQYAASDGKSYGNVRLQHDEKKPAGLLTTPIEFNDADETIKVTGKVVDPIAKELLAQGVLTGVSIGGRYIKKTLSPKDGITDYIAKPSEISVVDRPCLKEATFEVVKNEQGEVELRKFADEQTADELIAKHLPEVALHRKLDALQAQLDAFMKLQKSADEGCKCGMCESCVKRDFSDKERETAANNGHALPDGSFPINTVQDLKNAIQAIGRAKDPAKAKAHIKARAKALGSEDLIPDSWKAEKADSKSDTNKNREGNNMLKFENQDELQKAHKALTDRIADCHKAASDHCAAHKAAADEHMKSIHDHMDAMHKALTGEDQVPMETTKADGTKVVLTKTTTATVAAVAKTDDEKIAEAVAAAIAKAMPAQAEPTLEEKIAKAVETAMKPILEKANANQSKPRGTTNGVNTEAPKELTKTELDQLAKDAQSTDRQVREAAIQKMTANSASKAFKAMESAGAA